MEPLSPQRKWRAITIATLVLVPACWMMLAGFVAGADDSGEGVGNAAAAVAFGFALLPFVFLALALLSEHPTPPTAVLKAMALCVVFGIVVAVLAGDAVSGVVAGVGAGGVAALRSDQPHTWRARAVGVAVAVVYTFVLARMAGGIVLLSAPIFPFTAIGVADHVSERRLVQDHAG